MSTARRLPRSAVLAQAKAYIRHMQREHHGRQHLGEALTCSQDFCGMGRRLVEDLDWLYENDWRLRQPQEAQP